MSFSLFTSDDEFNLMNNLINPSAAAVSMPPSGPSLSYASTGIQIPDRAFPFNGSLPELRFETPGNDVVVGEEADDHDDLFSMYIDLKKLDEEEDHRVLANGGGFVVERGDEGGEGRGGGQGRGRKRNEDQTRKRTRRIEQKKICTGYDDNGVEVLEPPRKAILDEELAELWTINPKRARR